MLRELPQAAVMPLLSLLPAIGGGAAERAAVGEQGGGESGQVGPVARGGRSVHVDEGRRCRESSERSSPLPLHIAGFKDPSGNVLSVLQEN